MGSQLYKKEKRYSSKTPLEVTDSKGQMRKGTFESKQKIPMGVDSATSCTSLHFCIHAHIPISYRSAEDSIEIVFPWDLCCFCCFYIIHGWKVRRLEQLQKGVITTVLFHRDRNS